MSTQRYTVTPHPISTLLAWVESKDIAIPEIQRPFVWPATKVRDLLDSLYLGYPVGYLIAWRNPKVKLKDGTSSEGKRILIDGQQRVTALMAALLGKEVLNSDYVQGRIRIAFHPLNKKFEVANPAIQKDSKWIGDVAEVFSPHAKIHRLVQDYVSKNPEVSQDDLYESIETLRKIVNNHVGIIELDSDLDIETVTEIFIRVNSAGAALSQADFAMSKIAVNETYGGNMLRKAIDYFCHGAVSPEFLTNIAKVDKAFAESEFYPKMQWLSDVNDDLYDPTYTDMLRVAFTSQFRRGKMQDLVALLSGRNFETRQFEEAIAEESFAKLKKGVLAFINRTHFDRLTMIIRSAGFVTSDLIGSSNTINFAYILYLRGREEGIAAEELERLVRRWFVMAILRSRYTTSPESSIDFDVRQMAERGLLAYAETVIRTELPDSFWTGMLPQLMDTSSPMSPYFLCFKAAQAKLGDKGFLSRDITVRDLLLNRSDVHHLYPRNFLKKQGIAKSRYNQIANFALTQSEINIAIGDKDPQEYFKTILVQVQGGAKKFGGITELAELSENYKQNCIPESLLQGQVPTFEAFLEERRKLMALRVKTWVEGL